MQRTGPLGITLDSWEEVPLVELPYLLRIMMGAGSRSDALAAPGSDFRAGFLVDEEEEQIVIHAWRRRADDDAAPDTGTDGGGKSSGSSASALECIEQLIWYDTMASLAETRPCAEARVPSTRLQLADEGLGSREELVGDGIEDRVSGVADEDRARLGSLAFLRQFAASEAIESDILPHLFPAENGGGSGKLFRVLSATLGEPSSHEASSSASKPPLVRPKTIDDLFSDDVDFRVPAPWTVTSDSQPDEDPLRDHELTSVFLLNERVGFLLTFHYLQGVDPLSA